jgi:uncharacterized protein
LTKTLHLVDVNVLIARVFEAHELHRLAVEWFDTPDLQWAVSPLAEGGFLRFATAPKRFSMGEASGVLEDLAQHAGYHYHPACHNWSTLTKPFSRRLHGHNQVTDAYLLGMAIHDGLILATFDKGIVHLAGEYSRHVHLLGAQAAGKAVEAR